MAISSKKVTQDEVEKFREEKEHRKELFKLVKEKEDVLKALE